MNPSISNIFIFLGLCSSALSYKILVLSPMPARSHNNLGKGIADILLKAGHEITFVTAFPQGKTQYREIGVTGVLDAFDAQHMTFEKLAKTSSFEMLASLPTLISKVVEYLYETENIKKLLEDKNEKFDLVVVEYFLNHGLSGFGVRFDCPVILVSSVSPMHWLARLTGNPISPATVPNAFSSYNSYMTLPQRVVNTFQAIVQESYAYMVGDPLQEALYKKYLPEEAARVPFSKLHTKVALVLSNSHPSINNARPLLPNVVEICGYHIADPKPLPEEYQKILDGAKNGVIFFSMGSNLKSKDMPQQLKEDVLRALSKRKETVLWKYEEDLPGKPKNVIIRSWMPQAGILAHPNVKLFISHGGLLSTTEAASAGVPILSIPIFGDQFMNAQATQDRGNGILLSYANLTDDSLTWALNEVLGNSKYTEIAKKTYQLFHDRPMKPKELVAFYAEHVIKTGGAKHLSGAHLPLYALLQLDVITVIAIPPLILLFAIVFLCRKCCGKSNSKKLKKN